MAERKHLLVLLDGHHAGDLYQNEGGQVSFSYTSTYQGRREATPLSVTVPLAREGLFPHRVVNPWLQGLLPDAPEVRRRWATQFGVSPNGAFGLLTHVGEDVAGAAQFVRPDRVDAAVTDGRVEPVDEDYIADRLRVLRADRSAWRDVNAPGQFSLAGAQAKFALHRDEEGHWGLPSGRIPTTHILKPSLAELADQEISEHLCLRAADHLGLPAADSAVMSFGEEAAIVLTRYDRFRPRKGGPIVRIHQEDLCQALGVMPERKYEREDGGPGAQKIIALFRRVQRAAVLDTSISTFVKALAFNCAIYGSDAHAKNYSLFLRGSQVRLAPLYDISSVAAYPQQFDLSRMAMAMAIGGRFENRLITSERWSELAKTCRLDGAEVLHWVHGVTAGTAEAFDKAISELPHWARGLPTVEQLRSGIDIGSRAALRNLATN